MKFPTRGLYAITQTDDKSTKTIINEVEKVILGGAVVIQYRNKQVRDSLSLAKEFRLSIIFSSSLFVGI